MKVGILYEGKTDREALIFFTAKIILELRTELSFSDLDFLPEKSNGNIQGDIPKSVLLFFLLNSCNFAVFASDQDPGSSASRKKCRGITSLVNKEMSKIQTSGIAITAYPKPEIEAWLLIDEAAVKSTLSLPMNQQLPYGDLPPKARLQELVSDFRNGRKRSFLTDTDIYGKIAKEAQLSVLLTNSSFKLFFKKFKLAL